MLIERDSTEWERMWQRLRDTHSQGDHESWMYMGSDADWHYFKSRYIMAADGSYGVNYRVATKQERKV